MRIVLIDRDLTGQTLRGEPFSYIGRCTGTDVKFTGDWTHVSHFANIFVRPDWSGAKTRWSYSRFNAFQQAVLSPDAELLDHEMMLALFAEVPVLGDAGKEAEKVATALDDDRSRADYLVSWGNLAPGYVEAMKTNSEVEFRDAVGGREHLVRHMLKKANANPNDIPWDGSQKPTTVAGVSTTGWGIVARNPDGREYIRHTSEFPTPKNPHDRVELAELIEAEIEAAVGYPATLYIQSILPFRAYSTRGKRPRDWLMQ
jgi:hypothetical protein